jgi:hypothetical protein
MSACEVFAEAVLDESVPRPAGFEAHLAGCEKCRALSQSHAAAWRLQGAQLPQRRRVPVARVASRLAVAAAVVAVGLVVAFSQGKPAQVVAIKAVSPPVAPVEPAALPTEGTLTAKSSLSPFEVVDDGWGALAELDAFTEQAYRHNPSVERYAGNDFAASYLSMRRQQPLSGLGTRLPKLVSTSEE